MSGTIENLWQKFKGNGKVLNYSSTDIWVVETNTNHPHGPAIAHKLKPRTKSPLEFDIDGFKRVDGKAIENHSAWWKIFGYTTARLRADAQNVSVDVPIKIKVPENQFGSIDYDKSENWGVPIREVTKIEFDKQKKIKRYFVTELGWLTRDKAIKMTARGLLDNVVLVQPRRGSPYLRARPDSIISNNFV